jgi:hypothetical protein
LLARGLVASLNKQAVREMKEKIQRIIRMGRERAVVFASIALSVTLMIAIFTLLMQPASNKPVAWGERFGTDESTTATRAAASDHDADSGNFLFYKPSPEELLT